MRTADFDYELPQELIARHPAEKRDSSRLLVIHRDAGVLEHRHFSDIADYLEPGDCLVLNDSKVIPARLYGIKEGSGAKIEFLLSKEIRPGCWETLVRPGKRLRNGDRIIFGEGALEAVICGNASDGMRIAEFSSEGSFMETLGKIGLMPLPPYIDRPASAEDRDRYQTVYAREAGSVAAPTAGLHFTPELLENIKAKEVRTAFLTLHVGTGTFMPVKCERVEEHHMHFESYSISNEAAETINGARAGGGKIVCVGTTACRTIESASGEDGLLRAGSGSTDIFIYPGYKFKLTDRLISNFHLPRSTLIMLVSAIYSREGVLAAYEEAVREKYRFYSYGDACIFY